jgi:hypothetical protein
VNSLLVKVANFSAIAVWLFGILFVADVLALIVYVFRSGRVDEEEGRVVTEHTPQTPLSGNNPNAPKGGVSVAGKYWSKKKVLVSRSLFVSEMSLVDGTATKSQRFFVHIIQLWFLLLWLAFVFGVLTLLPSDPGFALPALFILICGSICGVTAIRRGRADALRKLEQKRNSRKPRQKL